MSYQHSSGVVIFCPTFGSQCGIASFAERLSAAFREGNTPVTMVGGSDFSWVTIAEEHSGSTFILQHEYQFHSPTRLRYLLRTMNKYGRVVVIQHTYHPDAVEYNETILKDCGAVVLHNPSAISEIVSRLQLKRESYKVIYAPMPFDKPYTKEELDRVDVTVDRTDEGVTLGFFGFSYEHKGLATLIQAVKILKDRGANVYLLALSSKPKQDVMCSFELTCLVLGASGLGDNVAWIQDYLPTMHVAKLLSQCDLVVFPYKDYGGYGASAALREACRVDTPIAITRTSFFNDVWNYFPHVDGSSPVRLADSLEKLLPSVQDGSLAEAYAEERNYLVTTGTWQTYIDRISLW